VNWLAHFERWLTLFVAEVNEKLVTWLSILFLGALGGVAAVFITSDGRMGLLVEGLSRGNYYHLAVGYY
jgi:hypothetical protein